jgi:hypothetical protein
MMTIKEKMTWFWYHFIPVDFDTVRSAPFSYAGSNSSRILYSHEKCFLNSLGNYKTLIRKMATQPAMMYYLNNQANTKNISRREFCTRTYGYRKDPLSQYTSWCDTSSKSFNWMESGKLKYSNTQHYFWYQFSWYENKRLVSFF